MNKLKIGVVGTGSISVSHLNAYQKNPYVEIYALCDIDPNRLRLRSGEYNVSRIYTDINDMLSDLPELDAVSVCTWNSAHAPCSIAALEAGKHVLCEKPMALNTQEALDMNKAAEKSGKLLMIGFVRRFDVACDLLSDLVHQGYFGEIYYAKASHMRRKGSPGGWFGDKSRSGGGPLIDLGVHIIDMTRFLMGNPQPTSVYGITFHKLGSRRELMNHAEYLSAGQSSQDIYDVEDAATAFIRYDNGSVVSVEVSFSMNIEKNYENLELFGTRAGARISPDLVLLSDLNRHMVNTRLADPTTLMQTNHFEREINHFVDCIMNDTPCRASAQDGITLMRIIDAIYASAECGHEIVLP